MTAAVMQHYFSYTHKSLAERAVYAKLHAQSVPQAEVMGSAHDESPGAKANKKKFKLPAPAHAPDSPRPTANSIVPKGLPCELAGVRSGDNIHIGGQVNDKRIFKFVSAEWDDKNGECYAYVQAPGEPHPVRVLASGIAKVSFKDVVKMKSKL